jgi:hypothetical protein
VSWRRNVRIGVGVAGLGVAAALFLARRDRPPVAPPPTLATVDPNSAIESQRGTWFITTRDGRQIGRLSYERSQTYDDGRQRFEQVTLNMEDEEPFELRADVIDTRGAAARGELPPEITASGHVRITKASGCTSRPTGRSTRTRAA